MLNGTIAVQPPFTVSRIVIAPKNSYLKISHWIRLWLVCVQTNTIHTYTQPHQWFCHSRTVWKSMRMSIVWLICILIVYILCFWGPVVLATRARSPFTKCVSQFRLLPFCWVFLHSVFYQWKFIYACMLCVCVRVWMSECAGVRTNVWMHEEFAVFYSNLRQGNSYTDTTIVWYVHVAKF